MKNVFQKFWKSLLLLQTVTAILSYSPSRRHCNNFIIWELISGEKKQTEFGERYFPDKKSTPTDGFQMA